MHIRPLGPADADEYVALRRESLIAEPFAFGASPEDDLASSADFMRAAFARSDQATFGAFDDELVGFVGVTRVEGRKSQHNGHVRGMYVRSTHRGRGLARQLMQEAIRFARTLDGVSHLQITVSGRAHAAATLYESLGFREWGTNPAGLCVDGVLETERYMVLALGAPGAALRLTETSTSPSSP